MGKRGSDDPKWQDLKNKVRERDGHCRLVAVLSAKEFFILQKNARGLLSHCDPAHVFGVGSYPKLAYDLQNVYYINRYSHDCLDYYKNPIDGKPITKEEHIRWWIRIIGEDTYRELLTKLKERV